MYYINYIEKGKTNVYRYWKIVVGALFYILVTGVLGLILNACIELGDITDIDFLYFWIIGVFLFALIYAVNY